MPSAAKPTPLALATHLGYAALGAVAALIHLRLLRHLFAPEHLASAQAAHAVIEGTPHWRLFQARLLGPYTVELFSQLTGSLERGYLAFSGVMMTLAGYLTLLFSRRLYSSNAAALGSFLLLQLLVLFLMEPHQWFYAWDYYELVLWSIFAYLVLRRAHWASFVVLFAISVLNRESALFIPLWMILEGAGRGFVDPSARTAGPLRRANLHLVIAGLVGLLVAIPALEALRTLLLVRESGWEQFSELSPRLDDRPFHWQWEQNLSYLSRLFEPSHGPMEFLFPLFGLFVVGFMAAVIWRTRGHHLALAATILLLLAGIALVGLLEEHRVYSCFVPFIAIGVWTVIPPNHAPG